MRIGSILSIASSGLKAASKRFALSAQNLANMNSDGYKASRTIDVATEDGGVESHVERVQNPGPAILRKGELVEGSNTDIVQDTVNQMQALQSYRANISVVKTASEMLEETTRNL